MKFGVSTVQKGWPLLKADVDGLALTCLGTAATLKTELDSQGNVLLKGLTYTAQNKEQPAHITLTEGPESGEWHRFHVTVEGPSVSGVTQRKKGKSKSLLGNHVYYEVGDMNAAGNAVTVTTTDKLYVLDKDSKRTEKTAPDKNEQVMVTNLQADVQAIITLFWSQGWEMD